MLDEVLRLVEQEELIAPQDSVIAGVSGGADSVCLLLILMEIRKKLPFSLKVVHIEHGIRGEESRNDAEFTRKLCEKNSISFELYPVDVPAYAARQGLGLEEAARILRYQSYSKAAHKEITTAACTETDLQCETERMCRKAEKSRKVHIALAHHAEDNAETILFQMVRGSGLDGLCGMLPKREFEEQIDIIRPLLKVTRGQIEQYLQEKKQEYCVDSTNKDTEYSRNNIRHGVIPKLREINKQAVPHINQSAELLRELKEYLDRQVNFAYEKSSTLKSNGLQIKWESLKEFPLIIQKEVIHKAICEMAASAKDIAAVHVENTIQLASQQVGRRISLPYQLYAKRNYDGILLFKEKENEETENVQISLGKEELEKFLDKEPYFYEVPGGKIRFQVLDFTGKKQEISKKTYTKCLDYDKIKGSLQIRNRQSGDYLTLDAKGHTKRLKEYFINEKIPAEQRDNILLLAQGAHIVWVIGGRISAEFKIEENTERILEVQFEGGNRSED